MEALIRPYQLTVLTTAQCTASCAHCSMSSSPKRKSKEERLSFPQIRDAIDSLHGRFGLHVVIFAGGEPTLLGEDLLNSIAHADSLGMVTRIVTNAYWARSLDRARSKLIELREAGLSELNISADDYHLPFIPFERVENAWRAAKGLGFAAVVIANCYGPVSIITPAFIKERLGEDLPERFDDEGYQMPLGPASADGTYYGLSNGQVQMLGRGNKMLTAESLVYRGDDESRIGGGCRWALRSPALSPRNHLVACCGTEVDGNEVLDFGSLETSDAASLAEKADDALLLNAVALLGPHFLKEFVKKKAPHLGFRKRYASMCEVCEHVMQNPEAVLVLKDNLPELAAWVLTARQGLEVRG